MANTISPVSLSSIATRSVALCSAPPRYPAIHKTMKKFRLTVTNLVLRNSASQRCVHPRRYRGRWKIAKADSRSRNVAKSARSRVLSCAVASSVSDFPPSSKCHLQPADLSGNSFRYRGDTRFSTCLSLRVPLYWLRYLPEEVPFQRDYHHQSAHKPREPGHPPILRQQLQASPTVSGTRAGNV